MEKIALVVLFAAAVLASPQASAYQHHPRSSWVHGRYHHHPYKHHAYKHRRYVKRPYTHHHRTYHYGQKRRSLN